MTKFATVVFGSLSLAACGGGVVPPQRVPVPIDRPAAAAPAVRPVLSSKGLEDGKNGAEIVTHVDARRSDGAEVDRAQCVNALLSR